MSKAFTKEEDDASAPLRAPVSVGKRRPITQAGFERLTREAQQLRQELISVRGEASTGSGARRLDLEAKLAQVSTLLAQVVPEPVVADPEGRAVFGARVVVSDTTGSRHTYWLAGPDEADAREGRISAQSPMGLALLGRKAGETVLLERPRGEVELTVIQVQFE